MTTKLFLLVLLFCLNAAANEKANNWLCDVKGSSSSQPDQFEISLKEPAVTWLGYFQQEDGSYIIQREAVISTSTVSGWKTDRSKCVLKGGFHHGEFVDNYDFIFSCGAIRGSFELNFKTSTGFYGEELTTVNVKRHASLENCRPTN